MVSTNSGDVIWDELGIVLNHYGYNEINTGKTGGSRRRFVDENLNLIHVHKPHPQNIVKNALREVLQNLRDSGQIKDE